jgi:hypothetical protein
MLTQPITVPITQPQAASRLTTSEYNDSRWGIFRLMTLIKPHVGQVVKLRPASGTPASDGSALSFAKAMQQPSCGVASCGIPFRFGSLTLVGRARLDNLECKVKCYWIWVSRTSSSPQMQARISKRLFKVHPRPGGTA